MASEGTYITVLEDERHGWRFGSGLAIYTERLVDGRLLGVSYVDNGLPVQPAHELRFMPAFDLVVDGESLAFGWEYVDFTMTGEGAGTLTLRHTVKPVELRITTLPGGHGCLRRSMQVTNTGDTSLGLTSVTPLQGVLWDIADNTAANLHDLTLPPFSVGHFRDIDWGNEGNFVWQDVPLNTEITFGSNRGRSGHTHPFLLLRNNLYGGYLLCALAWSANWRMKVYTEHHAGGVRAGFAVMPVAIPPMRVIAPGETVSAPEVHFCLNHQGFDETIQSWQAYLRESVLYQVGDGRQPVIFNHWGYMEHEVSEERLKAEIDIAAVVGAELFMVDAGWYGDEHTAWWETTGNWTAGNRLPNDLFPVYAYAREKGMLCGLWVEIESAGKQSRLAQEHPDWFITRYGKPVERVLDLAKPVVRDYVQSEIIRIIERYQLDMFRLDYNLDAWEGGFNPVDGRQENTLWRHVEAIYAIFDEVKRRFPTIQLENCSSGGGRTDLGIVSRFTTTWTSDWMRMPRTVRILNGMSMVLPSEYLDRLYGVGLSAGYHGELEAQLLVTILAHPTLSGITPTLAHANPALLATVKKYVTLYKEFIRPFHRTARVYHHTPVVPGVDGEGWCALEYVAEDRRRAVAGVFRLLNAETDTYQFRFRGLDPARSYTVTLEPGGQTFTLPGLALMSDGLPIRLDTALTARMIMAEAE
ncbi:MAG: alpha-galactosidase [Armatimonadota bacterium]